MRGGDGVGCFFAVGTGGCHVLCCWGWYLSYGGLFLEDMDEEMETFMVVGLCVGTGNGCASETLRLRV